MKHLLLSDNNILFAQWNSNKNSSLNPADILINSNDVVWWIYPYDDPETGKHFDFEWQDSVKNRAKGRGCPYLSGKAVWLGYNDLESKDPFLAKQWHPTKNGKLTPKEVTYGSKKKVWWLLPYDDPETGKHFDFEWVASICDRHRGSGCPFITGNKVWAGFNDLETKRPDLVKQWHPTKNGILKPSNVSVSSGKKVWWIYAYVDPETGKQFVFEWEAKIYRRSNGEGCPFLSGKRVWRGFNDLATKAPGLIQQWHPTKNGDKTPYNTVYGSGYNAWWIYKYHDMKTNRHYVFEWQAQVHKRYIGEGCPYIIGKKVYVGFNDLESQKPELAAQWHPTKNGSLKPTDVTLFSNRKVWWLYSYDDLSTGRHYDFEWSASICSRIKNEGCPFLSHLRVWPGYNDLESLFPLISAEWDNKKNLNITPDTVSPNSKRKRWWKCQCCGKSWYCSVAERVRGQMCKCNKLGGNFEIFS